MGDRYDEQAQGAVNSYGLAYVEGLAAAIAAGYRAAADGARREAVEEMIRTCRRQQQDYLSPQYAIPQPIGSISERFACGQMIEALEKMLPAPSSPDPVAAAREACSHTNLTRPEPEWECLRCGKKFGRGTLAAAAERAGLEKGEG